MEFHIYNAILNIRFLWMYTFVPIFFGSTEQISKNFCKKKELGGGGSRFLCVFNAFYEIL